MTDWSRLVDYVVNYFPEPKYSKSDIRKWIKENVPASKNMKEKDLKEIENDWEKAIYEAEVEPEVKELVEGKSKGFVDRIRRFLGSLF